MKQDNQLNTNLEAIPEKLKSMKNWIVCGTNELQKEGFYVLPINPPTAPVDTSRLRISLCADIEFEEICP